VRDSSATQVDDNRAALFRLGLILAAGVFAATITGVEKTVAVVFAVVLMVMLHELGHFATAKWTGMKVTEFFFGFGKRLWSVNKGETEYGVKAIPAGGYVKIIGMHNLDPVEPEDEPHAYRNQPTWARVLVTSAGSMMHFLLAFLMLFALNAFVGVDKPDGPLLQSRRSPGSRLDPAQRSRQVFDPAIASCRSTAIDSPSWTRSRMT